MASDPRAREAAFADLVAGLIDARVDLASARFDAELAAAEASGRLDPETARLLRWWQRESVRAVTDHARNVVPVALSALERSAVDAQEAVVQADAAWTTARTINARSLYPEPDVAPASTRPEPTRPEPTREAAPAVRPQAAGRTESRPPLTPEFDEDLGPEPPAATVPPAAPTFAAFADSGTGPFPAPTPGPPAPRDEPVEEHEPPAAEASPTPILRTTQPPPMPPPYVPPAERPQASPQTSPQTTYVPPVTASYDDPGPIVDKEDRPDAPPNDGRRRTLLAGLTVLQQDG